MYLTHVNKNNLCALQGLATGVMGQVQGIIPGMKKEEEVPDPAAMGQEGQEVYQDQQYYDQVIFPTGY